jgi:hypothetical protein
MGEVVRPESLRRKRPLEPDPGNSGVGNWGYRKSSCRILYSCIRDRGFLILEISDENQT